MKGKKVVSIIITCFNEEKNIQETYNRIKKIFEKRKNYDFECIFVDNDSTDTSFATYKKLSKKDKRVRVLIMSRNFGSPQPSFVAGMKHAQGDAVVLLHGDLQDPPEMIGRFIKTWEKGYDVVYGVRKHRKGYGIMWNFFYKFFYVLLKKLSYITVPLNAGEFSLIDKRVYQKMLEFDEYDLYLRGIRAFVGFKQIGIPYVRDERKHGRSTENFLSGLWWAKTMIINFSFKPLTWISFIAFFSMILSFLFILINVYLVLTVGGSPKGIPTIVILVLFLGGIQLLSLSIIAEYLAVIFLEVKKRPRYIIKESINI